MAKKKKKTAKKKAAKKTRSVVKKKVAKKKASKKAVKKKAVKKKAGSKKTSKKKLVKKKVSKSKSPKKKTAQKAHSTKKKKVKKKAKKEKQVKKQAVAKIPQKSKVDWQKFLAPLYDKILIEKNIEEAGVAGLIFITSEKPAFIKGKVLAVGKGLLNKKGILRPLDVEIGNEVILSSYAGVGIEHEGKKLLIVKEDEILGIED